MSLCPEALPGPLRRGVFTRQDVFWQGLLEYVQAACRRCCCAWPSRSDLSAPPKCAEPCVVTKRMHHMAQRMKGRPLCRVLMSVSVRVRQCVGVLAVSLRGAWRPYAAQLVEPMILTGLSPTLVQALQARHPPPPSVDVTKFSRSCSVHFTSASLYTSLYTVSTRCLIKISQLPRGSAAC